MFKIFSLIFAIFNLISICKCREVPLDSVTMATVSPAATADSLVVSARGGGGYGGGHGGGYGGGHGGGYGGGHGAVTMDPVSILGLLSLGAFLIRSILSLLTSSARSLDISDIDVPLGLSDIAGKIQSWEPTHVVRERSVAPDLLGFLQAAYKIGQSDPHCASRHLCRYWKSSGFRENELQHLFLVSLAQWKGDSSRSSAIFDEMGKLGFSEDSASFDQICGNETNEKQETCDS